MTSKTGLLQYNLIRVVFQTLRFTWYEAVRLDDSKPALVKKISTPESFDLERLRDEFTMAQRNLSSASLRAIEFLPDEFAIVYEGFAGKPVNQIDPPLPFFKLAPKVAEALATFHESGFLHQAICPENILYDVQTEQVKFVGAAPLRPEKNPEFKSLEYLLPYVAPELTGRIHTDVIDDTASDLYSLGAVFYELLSGRPPFGFYQGEVLQWLHQHVAAVPTPIEQVRPEFKGSASDIVQKQLSKMPGDRYQTAKGLQYDLATQKDASTRLGTRDFDEKFYRSIGFYGREAELKRITKAFDQVLRTNRPELVFIAGYSGSGKTTLVREAHHRILNETKIVPWLISGKFDQYKNNTPYFTIAQALKELVQYVLTQSETQISKYRRELEEKLGAQIQVLMGLVPELEAITGKKPPLPDIPLAELQGRFNYAIQQLLLVSTEERPLILFLDDLQWADPASLKLLQGLLEQGLVRNVLIICAYRDNEVSADHPLTLQIRQLAESGIQFHTISLGGLSGPVVARLIADSLKTEPSHIGSLSALVFKKTGGNPFFTIQLLRVLFEKKLIHFDYSSGQWSYDLEAIQSQGFADNIVQLMIDKLAALEHDTLELVKLGACFGNRFELEYLALVSEKSANEAEIVLSSVVKQGFVSRQDGGFRFNHDRIQQAAYLLTPESERPKTHLKIARLLYGRAGVSAASVFDTASHFLEAIDQIVDSKEKIDVARLMLVAGNQAQSTAAYKSAVHYFTTGIGLVDESAWKSPEAPLIFGLCFGLAKCEYLCGNVARSIVHCYSLLKKSESNSEKTDIYLLLMDLHQLNLEVPFAIQCLTNALRLFGIEYPTETGIEKTKALLSEVLQRVGSNPKLKIVSLPVMEDESKRLPTKLLNVFLPFAWYIDPHLLAAMTYMIIDLSLKHGQSEACWNGYAMAGTLLGPVLGKYQEGEVFWRAPLELAVKAGNDGEIAKISNTAASLCMFWLNPYSKNIETAGFGFERAVKSGNMSYAVYNLYSGSLYRFFRGDSIVENLESVRESLSFMKRVGFTPYQADAQALIQLLEKISVDEKKPWDTSGEKYIHIGGPISEGAYNSFKCFYYVLMGEFESALACTPAALQISLPYRGLHLSSECLFYVALAKSASFTTLKEPLKAAVRKELEEYRDRYRTFAELNPDSFRSKFELIQAELFRITGDDHRALECYEAAIFAAEDSRLVYVEALAAEFAYRFASNGKLNVSAQAYLKRAIDAYSRWGAQTKVNQLNRHLRGSDLKNVSPTPIDLQSVIKASQSISRFILLDEFLAKLMSILIEQAGADQGYLLVGKGGLFVVQATARLDEGLSQAVPESVINLVNRSKATLIVNDPDRSPGLELDPYFLSNHPRSILCLPILKQGKVVALLYLENNHTVSAFSQERISIIELLGTQAAISMENALLYRKAQESIRTREEFLAVTSHELRTPLTPLKLQMQTVRRIIEERRFEASSQEKLERMIENCNTQVDRIEVLVENLLDFSVIRSGALVLELEECDLREILGKVLSRYSQEIERAQIPITIRSPEKVKGYWSPIRLEQVLGNLIENAIVYGNGSEITIELYYTDHGSKNVVLKVGDHGIGIAAEDQDRVFELFERAVSSENRSGLGLGLYIAKEVVVAHGGTIQVESEIGKGTTFTVELPVRTLPKR